MPAEANPIEVHTKVYFVTLEFVLNNVRENYTPNEAAGYLCSVLNNIDPVDKVENLICYELKQ